MIEEKEAASSKAAFKENCVKNCIQSQLSLQVFHTKNEINFTQDVLEERIVYAYEWFDCCMNNLELTEINSNNFHKWIIHITESMKRIFELEDMLFHNRNNDIIRSIYVCE